jgi:acyl carrier protein
MTSVNTLELMLSLEDVLEIQIDVEEIQPNDVACLGALADFIAAQLAVAD